MESGVMYRFNIVNCEKPNSQFNFGILKNHGFTDGQTNRQTETTKPAVKQ